MRKMWMAGALALSLGAGLVGSPPAEAGSKGRKNTALGLGAAAAYELLRGKTTNGLILGAGAAYGYKRYKDAKEDEERYDRYGRYDRYNRYSDRYEGDRYDRRDRVSRQREYDLSRRDYGRGYDRR
jgi:hypothetical protein